MTSRRGFLQVLGSLSAVSVLRGATAGVEYVGAEDAIDVRARGRVIQRVASERPVSLSLSGHFLFAVNEIAEFQGLPSGSVESFAVDAATGFLTRVSRRALSLSATMPKSLAVSPNGRHLVVAAYGGGSYNVLPVAANGEIGRVTQAVKEIGCGRAAHPNSVVFHPSGRFVIATDSGAERVSVFRFSEGRMTRVSYQFDSERGLLT
jgi:6-phosphogluconolactonase (cycloisomerase 2 family)